MSIMHSVCRRFRRRESAWVIGALALGLWGASQAGAGQAARAEPGGEGAGGEPAGLAAKYPGDAGIARDPQVLFADDFETGTLADLAKRWGEMSNKDGKVMAFSDEVPPGSGGKRSLRMTATLGENTGGHLYTRLPRGEDTVLLSIRVFAGRANSQASVAAGPR